MLDLPVISATTEQLRSGRVVLQQGLERGDGRVSIYEEPRHDHNYVLGGDTALGIEGKDYDTAVILDKDADPVRQVAELQGHWGERFDKLVYATARFYNGAFVIMERQTLGLACLRRLMDEYAHAWLYFERDELSSNRRRLRDRLGYPKTRGGMEDPALTRLRRAVVDGALELVSGPLLEQMSQCQYRPRRDNIDATEAMDEELVVKVATGGSPDLVIAASMAWWGCLEIHHYPKPEERFEHGSAGHILGHSTVFAAENETGDPFDLRRS